MTPIRPEVLPLTVQENDEFEQHLANRRKYLHWKAIETETLEFPKHSWESPDEADSRIEAELISAKRDLLKRFRFVDELITFIEANKNNPLFVGRYFDEELCARDNQSYLNSELIVDELELHFRHRVDTRSCLDEIMELSPFPSTNKYWLEFEDSAKPFNYKSQGNDDDTNASIRFTRKQVIYLLQELIPEFKTANNTRKAEFITRLTGFMSTRNIADEFSNIQSFADPQLLDEWREKFKRSGRGRKPKSP